ncbi:Xaa-Pro peptidase family protein [Saccharibacillus sp. CPCC 101409]|uniref:M24 family metallopeptidase n=1 Tax=Saccharibacillus sp. CPCC 101409 TaxID=3058041 RepID=UPI00267359C2|nr:Xaa-Pro peptidase family protein [Saccharibacillus sp. CPCC 101409]MDO3408701.1 Xaa-Pro peptidase family protein [Saccharibacillus sp. CPCC 101409]
MNDQRWTQLRTHMNEHALDCLLITDPKHVGYLTGFVSNPHERFLGLAVPKENDPFLVVPALDLEAAKSSSSVPTIHTHGDTDDAYDLLRGWLGGGRGTIGIEKDHLSVSRFERLNAALGASGYADVGGVLSSLRAAKTPEEIEKLRAAVRLIEAVLDEGLKHVRVGATEIEIVAELEYQMKKLGAEGPSFDTMVLTGDNTALPHGNPGNRKIAAGDMLMFDMGVYLDGYASDITRTFAVAERPSGESVKIYETVLAANLAAIARIRPGVTLSSVDAAARRVIEEAGYGPYFMHRLGHGLGMDVHEYPSVHGANEELVTEGLCFTVEPGVYVAGECGVRIEDDIIVTKDGVDVLTSYPKELRVIG